MQRPDPEAARLTQAAGTAFQRRDFETTRQLAQALLLRRPLDPNANQLLGLVALEQNDPATAKRHLERANQAAPGQPAILNSLGVALNRCGDTDAARAMFLRAGEGGLIDGWRNLGNLEERALNYDASISAYQRALRIAPNDPASHGALAQAYERRHDVTQARKHADKALAGDPSNENARLALAHVLLREKDFAGVEALAAPVAQRGLLTNQSLAWGVIGEARDRLDDARGAFAAFTAANRILRSQHAALLSASHLLYHPDGVRRMTALAARADISAWRPPAAFSTPAPAFLVGFPRSGTTLLDQILSSHSRLVCIEEREHLANALASVISDREKLAAYASLSDHDIASVREEYWRRVLAEQAPPEGALVVDKLPLNIVILPLIKRVFPDSKIIFALRDPRDVILSCYQQRFGMNAAMAQFLDLNAAAAYYDAVMSLMQVCRDRLDLALHQVRYEDVVADLEGAARELVAFLEQPFEPAMLDFQKTAMARDINTPSARQVVQPLYTRSIGRWRRYAQDMAPVLPILSAWAERFGYPS
ncbi:MAG: sulfotransferase [Hyphomonadaceae bacterium]